MKLQRQPNVASCLATSFAIVLDVPVEEIFKELGHDGMDVVFPGLPGCRKYRVFHIQEMIDLCFRRNRAVTVVEARPNRQESDKVFELPGDYHERFANHLRDSIGVLVGETFTRPHAVAWNGFEQKVYDPDDVIKQLSNLKLKLYLKVSLIHGLD